MSGAPFKPGDVELFGSFPPFAGTFEKTECEIAAFYIVRTLAASPDNTWRPVAWPEIGARLQADTEDAAAAGDKCPSVVRLVADLVRNRFALPDVHGLIERGFARWHDEPAGAVELTELGLERLRRWVR